jgi:hypothetical protein
MKRVQNNPTLQLKDLNKYLHSNCRNINEITRVGKNLKETDSLSGMYYYLLAIYFNKNEKSTQDIYYLRKAYNCFDKFNNLKMKHETLLKFGESFGHYGDFIFQEKVLNFILKL